MLPTPPELSSLAEAAEELDPIDNLFEANQMLREDVARLQAEFTAERDRADRYITDTDDQILLLRHELTAAHAVIEAVRPISLGWGHNMPGWESCERPGNCPWERLSTALARFDQARADKT